MANFVGLAGLLPMILLGDMFNIGAMSSEVLFGLKLVALVMVYGYMHMNLGGGILSTAVFLVFAYYFLFVAQGILAIMVLGLFFVMIHGFDMIWGGDILRQNVMMIREAKHAGMMEPIHYHRPQMPPQTR